MTVTEVDVATAVAVLLDAAAASGQRRLLLLAGEHGWCLRMVQSAMRTEQRLQSLLWIGEHAVAGIRPVPKAQALQILGCEVRGLLFDAHEGFDPDAFGAVSGAVRGGGLLLLLTPPLSEWPAQDAPDYAHFAVTAGLPTPMSGRFLERFLRLLVPAPGVTVLEQGRAPPRLGGQASPVASVTEAGGRWEDQQRAVAAVMQVVTGHRRRPAVLISDRGRGKSAAMGIAAARLLRKRPGRVLVTAPRRDAVSSLFEQAQRLLPEARVSPGGLHLEKGAIEFLPPDAINRHPSPADLVLVDEAAAIPVALLERLLDRYARIVFATTVHGYEGSGRGFAVRFSRVLDAKAPGWKLWHLNRPIRWAVDDPLERLVFKALLLDAAAAADADILSSRRETCSLQWLDRDDLVKDERTLSELFGLLVLAHYRTTPRDLRYLLDSPNLSLLVLRYHGHVVATALVALEGGFDRATARAIHAGRRRPRGHLVPQSLAVHVGLAEAPELRCARIVRIAVHPAVQGRGLGRRLVDAVAGRAVQEDVHYVAACFGATVEVLRFWSRCDFHPVRVGSKRGAASGSHSVIVLRPLSSDGHELSRRARRRFGAHLPHQLGDPLRDLDTTLAAMLMRGTAPPVTPVSDDWLDVEGFALDLRPYDATLGAIWRLVCVALADPRYDGESMDRELLVARVLQQRRWREVAALLGVPGKAAVTEALRAALRRLIGAIR